MRLRLPSASLLALGVASLAVADAHAQSGAPQRGAARPQAGAVPAGPPQPQGWSFTVGVAPVFSPIYEGSDDYGFSIFPDLRIAYGSRFTFAVPEGARYRLINTRQWQAGPLARLRFGRDADSGASPFLIAGETDDLEGFDQIDLAVEFGAFAQRTGFFGDPRKGAGWRIAGEVRQGVGGHDGVVGEVSASAFKRFGKTLVAGGPRVVVGSNDYTSVYFGVTPEISERTGVAAFEGDGTYLSYGVGLSATRPLNSKVSATAFTRYERLGAEAADSPIVADLGDEDQLTMGFSLSYRF